MTVHVLRMHAGYQCEHVGECCTAGWGIPVEAPLYARLQDAIAGARLRVDRVPADALFDRVEARGRDERMIAGQRDGACVFFERARGNLCAIHRQLGESYLPSACRHYPRVVVLDPRGVFVSLSCLCPTAGRLLTAAMDRPFEIVSSGAVVVPGLDWEGLDAREALPPRLSAGVLWDWEALTCWQRGVLALLETGCADAALARLTRAAARVARWRPSDGVSLARHAAAVFEAEADADAPAMPGDIDALDALARASVPADLGVRPAPPDRQTADRAFVAPAWPELQPVVARYVAGHVLANWAGHYTSGPAAWVAALRAAAAVLRTEAARQCRDANRVLDASLLVRAAGEADRLLVHMAEAAVLARRLDGYVGECGMEE